MKKRTVWTIVIATVLVVLAFVGGSVFAQLDLTSSSAGGEKAPVSSGPEAAPGSIASASGESLYSTADGKAPVAANVNTNESQLNLVSIDGLPPSSASSEQLPLDGSSTKVEPAPNFGENEPSAPTSNTSIRFVGNTLKPRANVVNYDVTGDGGCVYVTSGDAFEVWDLPLALPNGVRVEYLRMYYLDNSASNMVGWFTKYDLYGNIVNEWGVQSTGSGYNYTDVAITPNETINYNAYSYVINWRPIAASSSLQLCGFRLFYTQFSNLFIPFVDR